MKLIRLIKDSFYIALILLLIFSCQSQETKRDNSKLNHSIYKKELKFQELDSYSFRRNYFGHENLEGKELDSFVTRNPDNCYKCPEEMRGRFYEGLVKNEIFVDNILNLSKLDSLPTKFKYRYSHERIFDTEFKYLDYDPDLENICYEFTFFENDKIVAIDTLEFGFPPDVQFSVKDLNQDGKDEILTLFRWYIINGDNFDFNIYTLDY